MAAQMVVLKAVPKAVPKVEPKAVGMAGQLAASMVDYLVAQSEISQVAR